MHVGEGEEKIDEYYFPGAFGGTNVANLSVLTNRRLVVVYGNAEESYLLSKITAVRIIFNRSRWMLIVGALIGLASLGDNVLGGLIGLAIGGGLCYLGWKGKTHLVISHMGGEKHYPVRGKSQALIEFMNAVNSKLA